MTLEKHKLVLTSICGTGARRLGYAITVRVDGVVSTSRGLVGDTVFAVLPSIKPLHTFAITIATQSVFLTKLWLKPTYKSFVAALTLCGYTSYMFGWHVHEKAILLVLVPLRQVTHELHFTSVNLACTPAFLPPKTIVFLERS